jgi:two-component system phosphate regulon sensor histidine kinase PhoR
LTKVTHLQDEIFRIGGLLALAVAIGATTDAWGLALALALSLWIAWQVREFLRFARWSRRPLGRPRNASAPWEAPVLRLYRALAASRARCRRLLRELRRFATITRVLPDAAVVIDRAGEIEVFNGAASTLLGLTPSDRGRNLATLLRHPALRALLSEGAGDAIVEMPLPKDPERQLEVRRIAIDADRQIVMARDVTQLNRLLSTRQDFVANVSHELRSPLTVIMGYLETLEDESLGADEVRAILARLHAPARRMRALVDDLLLLTRLESSPGPAGEELDEVRVDVLLKAVVEETAALSNGRHEIVLSAEPGLRLHGVESELHSAFTNLVSNAVRYSPGGGRIDVRWLRTAAGPRFEVQDQGLGIAPEHLSRITERFYRVDLARSRARGGTGLGLAITKHVLKRHGTALELESTLGKGSRFWCVFPPQLVPDQQGKECR